MSERTRAADPLRARYDETPYRDQSLPNFDLARMLGLARLFGVRGPVTRETPLRVLDLACASGLHIREQAERYPQAHFTGIDFSEAEIALGRKAIAESGCQNVELVHGDLRGVEIPRAEFDLVLCSGAFSWVADDVKERIFELCRLALAPTGIAAVAYLTYPGWKQREAIRELLAFRVRDLADPEARVRESALVLRLLKAGYAAHGDSPHAASLEKTVADMQESSANVFLHDELGTVHDPCYFTHFVEWAGEWGLSYLAEADLGTMAVDALPGEAEPLLQRLAPDFIETQQLIDFVVNRSGRTSLLVRADAAIDRELSTGVLEALSYRTMLCEVTPRNAPRDAPSSFETPRGPRIELDRESLESRILCRLQEAGPLGVSFGELADGQGEVDRDSLLRVLGRLVARGYADPLEPGALRRA